MSSADQNKWDRLHAHPREDDKPSLFLNSIFEQFDVMLSTGRALDVACGKGRNALFLAERGFDVTAIDISPVALEEGRRRAEEKSLRISWQQADLEQIELPQVFYDLIVNFNYLQRSLTPQIKKSLKSGGHVIFETYLIDQQIIGHPKNPAYLLEHNELPDLFKEMRVLWYREGKFTEDHQETYRAGLFAQKQ